MIVSDCDVLTFDEDVSLRLRRLLLVGTRVRRRNFATEGLDNPVIGGASDESCCTDDPRPCRPDRVAFKKTQQLYFCDMPIVTKVPRYSQHRRTESWKW